MPYNRYLSGKNRHGQNTHLVTLTGDDMHLLGLPNARSPLMRLFALFAAFTVSGCGLAPPKPYKMYEGGALPVSEISVLAKGTGTGNEINTFRVTRVDGKTPGDVHAGPVNVTFFTGFSSREISSFHLLPGTHVVRLGLLHTLQWNRRDVEWQEIEFTAEAGRTYVPRFRRGEAGEFVFWIEDKGVNYPEECLSLQNYKKLYIDDTTVEGC